MKNLDRASLGRAIRAQAFELVLYTSLIFITAGSLWSHFSLGQLLSSYGFVASLLLVHGLSFSAVHFSRLQWYFVGAQMVAIQLYFNFVFNVARLPFVPLAPVFFVATSIVLTAYSQRKFWHAGLAWATSWMSASYWIYSSEFFARGPKTALVFAVAVNFMFILGFLGLSVFANRKINTALQNMGPQKAFEDRRIFQAKLQSIGELTAGLTHEINNPLSAIAGYSFQIKEEVESGVKDKEAWDTVKLSNERIKYNVDRIKEIVRLVKGYSRYDFRESFRPVSLRAVLDDSLQLLHHSLRSEGIDVKTNYPEFDLEFEGSFVQMSQVFVNLISNAKDACKESSRKEIQVGYELKDEKIRVWVEDSGLGIEEDLHAEVFKPFFTTKEPGKGTGLGLSICKTILERHKGEISFKSRGRLKGTVFSFVLPNYSKNSQKSAA